jgi:hypothetical protein
VIGITMASKTHEPQNIKVSETLMLNTYRSVHDALKTIYSAEKDEAERSGQSTYKAEGKLKMLSQIQEETGNVPVITVMGEEFRPFCITKEDVKKKLISIDKTLSMRIRNVQLFSEGQVFDAGEVEGKVIAFVEFAEKCGITFNKGEAESAQEFSYFVKAFSNKRE